MAAFAPSHPAALTRAHALHKQGRLAEAEALYRQVLKAEPRQVDALQLLALIEAQNQRHAEAIALFDQALKLRPELVPAWVNRGVALQALNRYPEAIASYERALALQPAHLTALCNRAVVLKDLKRHADALSGFDAALRLSPNHVEALHGRSEVLQKLGRHAQALQDSERCLVLQPDRAEVWMWHGAALMRLGQVDPALTSYDRAVQLDPHHADALLSRAFALQQVGRHAEARECYARARVLRPDHAVTQRDEALCALLLGDFEAGWPQYEWRFRQKRPIAPVRDLRVPRWDGTQDLQGRTLLLHTEQGLGDTIQFCRYAKAVAARGARVVFEVDPPLKALLAGLDGVDSMIVYSDPLPAFDLHCPLLSLPMAFRTDLASIPPPAIVRAPEAQVEAWKPRLGADPGLRVGLVWSGSAGHVNDLNRSIPLADFSRILISDTVFCALQTELRDADRPVLQAHPEIRFFGDELRDFTDTAALIESMDVVVTVDTSVAHLAGSMGKPVWILLPANPDWRWLIDREDSPWYPTARLFRQPVAGDWESVLDRVREALTDWREQRER